MYIFTFPKSDIGARAHDRMGKMRSGETFDLAKTRRRIPSLTLGPGLAGGPVLALAVLG